VMARARICTVTMKSSITRTGTCNLELSDMFFLLFIFKLC
jgi:hypothetical protein